MEPEPVHERCDFRYPAGKVSHAACKDHQAHDGPKPSVSNPQRQNSYNIGSEWRQNGRIRQACINGLQMQKEWMATLDGRTRDSHRDLDGERVPYDEPFSNGLMFPADPQGAGREVWNCRCTMRAIFPENSEPRKMTYNGRNAEEAYKKMGSEQKRISKENG